MATRRRQQFVYGQALWMCVCLVVLAGLKSLAPETYFVLSLVGFLILIETTSPFEVSPSWRRRIKWIAFLGLLVFGYVLVRRILNVLPVEVF